MVRNDMKRHLKEKKKQASLDDFLIVWIFWNLRVFLVGNDFFLNIQNPIKGRENAHKITWEVIHACCPSNLESLEIFAFVLANAGGVLYLCVTDINKELGKLTGRF